MQRHSRLVPLAVLGGSALVLAGCASGAGAGADAGEDGGDDRIQVVASTNVYGQIAEEIGGDRVEVTSIVSSAAQDPHSFEPSARDQLAVSRADLVLENGGGYDAFIDALIEASGSTAPVLTASEFSHDWPENAGHDEAAEGDDHAEDEDHAEEGDDHAHEDEADHDHAEDGDDHAHDGHAHVEGFNEHVWYDPHTMEHFAEAIAEELTEIDPDGAETYAANAEAFADGVHEVEESLAGIEAADAGARVFVTEPVPLYLVRAAGLENVTPEAFTEAVEEGQDVPPATLLAALDLLADGEVRILIANAQTGGAETTQVIDDARERGIPVLEFAETLPEGQTYLSWMQENVAAISDALAE
jgi:zinc/manganese transport system substrate-binding protein